MHNKVHSEVAQTATKNKMVFFNLFLVTDSVGELDFVLPYLIAKEYSRASTLVLISATLSDKVRNDALLRHAKNRFHIRIVSRMAVQLNTLICLLTRCTVHFHFNYGMPRWLQRIARLLKYRNIKTFPHTGFYYYTFPHPYTRYDLPEYVRHVPVLIQSQRYTANLHTKMQYQSFEITGSFHGSELFTEFVDSVPTPPSGWPEIMVFSYPPRQNIWPEEDWYNAHQSLIDMLDRYLPYDVTVGFKLHPRAPKLTISGTDRINITTVQDSAFVLSRNSKLNICMGPSSVAYAGVYMKTPTVVYFDYLQAFLHHKGITEWFDPNYDIPVYQDLESFEQFLRNFLTQLFSQRPNQEFN